MTATSSARTAQAIRDAQRKFPQLCAHGVFGFRIVGHAARLAMAKHFAPTISAPIAMAEVETAIEFLAMLDPTKTGRVDSYKVKHVAEDWGRCHDLSGYVSNGAVIAAALALGLAVEPCGPPWAGSPNVMIGVSEKSLRRKMIGNDFMRRERRGRSITVDDLKNGFQCGG
jgi:hypothetical protein